MIHGNAINAKLDSILEELEKEGRITRPPGKKMITLKGKINRLKQEEARAKS